MRATPVVVGRMAERHPWLFVAASIVFWTVLWPLFVVWLVLWLVDRHRSLDTSPSAMRERRVARLLRWYPAEWRDRYGDEMAGLLDDMIVDGRGGPRLGLDAAREGLAARLGGIERRGVLASVCLGLCAIPLLPQGLVPAIVKLTGTSARSWFLALHLPDHYQWPMIAGMIALGLAMLGAGISLVHPRSTGLPDAARD